MSNTEDSLLNRSAINCLNVLEPGFKFMTDVQFWQTWANLEAIAFMINSKSISQNIQQQAMQKAAYEWLQFDFNSSKPTVFTGFGIFKNSNFWDPGNMDIIWDDRLWLGCSYLALYEIVRAQAYLELAKKLYNFNVQRNADWRKGDYRGLQWKPKTDYRNSITNQLFFVLCARLYHITKQKQYWEAAQAQYKLLFLQEGKYFNNCGGKNIFPDALGPDEFYTYNQGVALQGLAFMLKYGSNKQKYMQTIVKLTNGMIDHFRNYNQPKLIIKQFSRGNYDDMRTGVVFRSFVFRHIINIHRLLSEQQFKEFCIKVPRLKILLLDNAQAMCKFQNLSPSWNWELYNDNIIFQYSVFNQFFVLLAARQIFGINQVIIDGIVFESKQIVSLDIKNQNVEAVYLSTFSPNDQGIYKKSSSRPLSVGSNQFSRILDGQRLTTKGNTRNMLQIVILMSNGKQISFALFHQQSQASQFALIGNCNSQQILNNYVMRVRPNPYNSGISAESQNLKIQMSGINGYLVLLIK